MNKLGLTKDVKYDKIDNVFIDPRASSNFFYEKIYILINPNLHREEEVMKTKIVQEIIRYLFLEYKFVPRTIADMGSGSTKILKNILDYIENNFNVVVVGVAIDISLSILKSSPSCPNIYKLRADAKDLPIKDGVFDVLLLIDLIEHTSDPVAVIEESLRVAKFIVIKVPLELSFYTFLRGGGRRLKELEKKYGHIQHFNYRGIQKMLLGKKTVWESYSKIPNRSKLIDLLQEFLLKFRFFTLFRVIFGGFIVLVVANVIDNE